MPRTIPTLFLAVTVLALAGCEFGDGALPSTPEPAAPDTPTLVEEVDLLDDDANGFSSRVHRRPCPASPDGCPWPGAERRPGHLRR